MRLFRGLLAIVAGAMMLAVTSAARAQTNFPLKIAMLHRPAGAAQLFMGDGKAHAAYELYVANFSPATIHLRSLSITGTDASGHSNFARMVSGAALKRMYSAIGADMHKPQDPVLKSGEAGIIFVFLDFPSIEKSPTSLANRVEVAQEGKPGVHQTLTTANMEVSHSAPIEIGSPLRGTDWWTPNGPSNDCAHRRAVIALNDLVVIPERFAVDWIKLGPDGQSYHGDKSKNSNYYAYGVDIYAVGDGRVTSVMDGIPENVPNSGRMAVTIDLKNIAGNNVIEDLGGGRYAMYAHLIPGSLRVKPGDHVIKGQVIGRLGNSGNSSEPHLHFQISTGTLPLDGEGVPFEIESFKRVDYKLDMKGETPVKLTVGAAHEMTGETFMNEDLADFGSK
jgi:murein DD-endopeptidase MepM/ murein hydrolase activator NlpD